MDCLRGDGDFGSFSINAKTGAWADSAEDDEARGGDVVSLVAYVKEMNSQVEAATMLSTFLDSLEAQTPSRPKSTANLVLSTTAAANEVTLSSDVALSGATATSAGPPEIMSPARQDETIPVLNPHHREFGLPSHVHYYRDAHGMPTSASCRYQAGGKKTFIPYTLQRPERGPLVWEPGMHKSLRPLYNRDQLAARPRDIAVVCEGEKTAEAAAQLLPDAVATTTMGGALAASKSDFRPLAGRTVLIAPDNDEPGGKYRDDVIRLACLAGATDIGVIQYPKSVFGITVDGQLQDVPKGYDLADALAAGWTADRLAEVMQQIVEVVHPVALIEAQTLSGANVIEAAPSNGRVPLTVLADEFVMRRFRGRLHHDGSGFRAYVQGYWPIQNQAVDLEKELTKFLGPAATPRKIKELIALLTMQHACRPDEFEHKQALICLLNGTLDPVTVTLQAHSPGHLLPTRLGIEWQPQAQCPLWLQTLAGIFQPDDDRAQKIALLQEFIGYCLIADTRMCKFLWMIGAGANGKSLVLEVIEHVIGRENVSHAQLDRIQDENVRAELQGKLVNISSEMSAQSTVADGYLKQIVSGDSIEAERKFQTPFSFKPYVRLIGATNALPALLDHSDGFFRRAIILTFNRRFAESEQDRTLGIRLREELPGIFVWAVNGLQRLLARDRFDIPPSSEQALSQYRIESNPVQQFAEEFLVQPAEQDDWVTAQSLYTTYSGWALEGHYRPLTIATFKTRLSALGFVQTRTNVGRYWQLRYVGRHPGIDRYAPRASTHAGISDLASRYQV